MSVACRLACSVAKVFNNAKNIGRPHVSSMAHLFYCPRGRYIFTVYNFIYRPYPNNNNPGARLCHRLGWPANPASFNLYYRGRIRRGLHFPRSARRPCYCHRAVCATKMKRTWRHTFPLRWSHRVGDLVSCIAYILIDGHKVLFINKSYLIISWFDNKSPDLQLVCKWKCVMWGWEWRLMAI